MARQHAHTHILGEFVRRFILGLELDIFRNQRDVGEVTDQMSREHKGIVNSGPRRSIYHCGARAAKPQTTCGTPDTLMIAS